MSKKQFFASAVTILLVPFLILLLLALCSGCNDAADNPSRPPRAVDVPGYSQNQYAGEFRHLSTIGGHGEDVFRTRYTTYGMTYEVVYIVAHGYGAQASNVVSLQVVNLTKDSLECLHLSPIKK